jgi:thymidylate kinase/thymidylate synthase ThyX
MANTSKDGGTFIVIEGIDGSGKGVQTRQLAARLEKEGYDIATFDFPQFEQPSSFFVREYLNGKYGRAETVGPYTAALFYALDRYQAAPKIRAALEQGKVVIANRFAGSNMAHQGMKFQNVAERRGYFIWLDNLEFETLQIPRPTHNFVLRVPAETAQTLIDRKETRDYTEAKRDLHEADLEHLQKAVAVYDDLCQLFPRDFQEIDCMRSGQLMDVQSIHEIIWEKIKPILPAVKSRKRTVPAASKSTQSSVAEEPNPYLQRNKDGTYEITPAGEQFLSEAVSDKDGDIYAFTHKLDTVTVAAAMARLSRRSDDMRITILDEFAHTLGRDAQLLQRVITAYGDDSVQQLAGIHVVVEGASNLLTKKLEWGRLGAYLEQSTRYIYYDQRDQHGNYRYFTPDNFEAHIKDQYRMSMDQLFTLYSSMVHGLADYISRNSSVPKREQDAAWRSAVKAQACDAVRPVLPVATKSTVGIYASGQTLESLVIHLLSDQLPEARETGQTILEQSRKVAPVWLERADKPDRGGAAVAYRANTREAVRKLAEEYLPDNHAESTRLVDLVGYWPKNELDLVADMLYEHSDLSLRRLQDMVVEWPYTKKTAVFQAYIGERLNRRHRPGRALEKAHYSWDIMCDYGIFRDLQRHRMVDDIEWQELTPRYGYDIPQLIEDAGLVEQFEACFNISLKLHSFLQAAGHELEAQYATLLGHKMRWKVTYNAREAFHIHELRTSPQGHPGYRHLVQLMHERLCEVHPMLGQAMKFVNQGEDPELTRLAAERYTQYRLDQLGRPETGS